MAEVTKEAWFSPGLFSFLTDLQANNNREWIAANKQRYKSSCSSGHLVIEHKTAAACFHDREHMSVPMRVDADHVVQLVCQHLLHSSHRLRLNPVSVWV